ncbi:hypothetical protein KKC63_01575 [Patescibacteria group bacterium]|nr:hypothetical protein [Patescibacteria group bacterium]MBU4022830.1 hypothetical protein [Patescibacteria group bacterium]MBU4078433.1 hypothetical protein [Patescibacteria group bacterium]
MVQVIPRTSEKSATRLNLILPWFSLLLVVVVIVGIFFLSSKINASNKRISQLDAELSQAKSQEEIDIEKKLMAYKKKVSSVISILEDRKRILEFYSFLEELVHPDVYFNKLSLDMTQGIAMLTGIAKDFKALGQQISAFKESGYIFNAQAETVSLDEEEGIGFAMSIVIFEPEEKK